MAIAEAEVFCRRLWPRLVGSMSLYCGDRAVGEEIAQEALSRVWARWDTVGSMAAPEAWAYRCATNLANSWYRRRQAERRAFGRVVRVAATGRDSPDDAARVAVRTAVSRLPTRQRTAVVLRFYADLPVEQVAELMGCEAATVRAHTFKAVAALRRAGLADVEEDTDDARTS
jgi:RNA polymerase sigma-70 factor (ECF subfamily)